MAWELRVAMKKGLIILLLAAVAAATGFYAIRTFENADTEVASEVAETTEQRTDMSEASVYELEPVDTLVYDFDSFNEAPRTSPSVYMEPVKVKGLYVTGPSAGNSTMDTILHLADTTEINAVVIDVKNDSGYITFNVDHPIVQEIDADRNYIKDIRKLMDTLYEHDVYPIARIVAFKDPQLAENKTDYAIHNKDGSVWKYKNIAWLNPYNEDTWEYIVDMAKIAADVGFKEIQFDYIRFEATKYLDGAYFGNIDPDKTRRDAILEFVDYAMAELKPLGVVVSADVFGTIIASEIDSKTIGQEYIEMAKRLDVICPMVYPSHYGFGYFGAPSGVHSDHYPYETILGSMELSNQRYEEIGEDEHGAIVRPWLQAFTASYLGSGNYITYDAAAIREQIQGAYDAGLNEWLLWNASNKYREGALLPE